jgi:hypothetical protein
VIKKVHYFPKGNISLLLFLVLSICGSWLHAKGLLIKMFNGGSALHHIAYEIDHDPVIRYGIIVLYIISIILFFLDRKGSWKKLRLSFLTFVTVLIIPLYTHIIINEYKMEVAPFHSDILRSLPELLDYALLEDYTYNKKTKSLHVTLNYGTSKNHIWNEYLNDETPLTNLREHQIKQRLNSDMNYVIHEVWSQTHQPKQIVFTITWGKNAIFTTSAQKRERYLSYLDNDESDDFQKNKLSLYYHVDVVEEGGNYILKLKTNDEHWVRVTP